jgi:hypothetical protein
VVLSLVEQLQADALDASIKVSMLLRRVKLIAAKLDLSETAQWADAELDGYRDDLDDAKVPPYRQVTGQVKAFSPYHGWQSPAGDSEIIDMLCKRVIGDPISALEDLLERESDGKLVMLIANNVKHGVLKSNYGWTDMHTEIPRSAIVGVIDRVRNMVLNWAIELEQKGISGSGVTFDSGERQRAAAAHINIQNFQGSLNTGNIEGTGNRINVGSADSSNSVIAETVFGDLEDAIRSGISNQTEQRELLEAVSDMRAHHGKRGFIEAYQKFVGLASDHLSLLAPFIPALGTLVS